MSLMVRTLMFLACLLYGTMPMQMALGMPAAMAMTVSSPSLGTHGNSHHDPHGGHPENQHEMIRSGKATAQHAHGIDPGGCCQTNGDAAHPVSCAACLIVVPKTVFADHGRAIFSYPKPQRGAAFAGKALAPPLPPPRA